MGIVPTKNRVTLFLLFNALFLFSVLAHKNGAMRHPRHEELENSTRLKGKQQMGSCNLFQGSWVFDIQGSPLYDSSTCPFINPEFDCIKYGRPDKQFLKYSWKPDNCLLPRFDGVEFLNKLRGKNIMFVGDSLSLNQWNSLTCMLHASAPQAKYSIVKTSLLYSVTFQEYAVSILLYHSSYLVDILTEPIGRVLNLGSLLGGNAWKNMDVLIFNTWHWWVHTGRSQPWDYVRDGGNVYKDMDRVTAFYKGLTMWANWVDNSINSTRTRVFFQGISPTHYNPSEWNGISRSCSGEAEPLSGSAYPGGSLPAVDVLNKVLASMKKSVFLLDITTLSQLRKDAHPEAYSGEHPGIDCSHWCLPGLPDTWNLLFNAALCIYWF